MELGTEVIRVLCSCLREHNMSRWTHFVSDSHFKFYSLSANDLLTYLDMLFALDNRV